MNLSRLKFPCYKSTKWAAAIIIVCVTFVVYLPVLQNGFVNWDDYDYVYENQHIKSIDGKFLRWALTAVVSNHWHPLTLFSHALDYSIWGFDPRGHHLTNIFIHSLNTLLVFILAYRLTSLQTGKPDNDFSLTKSEERKSIIAGAITSLMFGIHPLHVESVAWASERKDVLCAFFFLLSLLTYLKYVRVSKPASLSLIYSKKSMLYAACLILFIMALMSKSMAITLPIVFLIIDVYTSRRLTTGSSLTEKAPFFLLSLLSSFAAIGIKQGRDELTTLAEVSLVERIFASGHTIIFYMLKILFPFNLAAYYPRSTDVNFFSIEYAGYWFFLLLITFSVIRSWERNKIFLIIWSYYIVTLLPVIGIFQFGVQSIADRYTYLPSLGPFLLAGLGVGSVFERYSKRSYQIIIVVITILISCILSSMTVKQIAAWKDSITLWSHNIRLLPDTADIAYINRGMAYISANNTQLAIADFNKAVSINHQDAIAYCDRGFAYKKLGKYQQALDDLNKAIEIDPEYERAYNNRGSVYNHLSKHRQAIDDYNRAIEINPEYADAYSNRGNTYIGLGSYLNAIDDLNRAIKINPEHENAYNNRGNAYMFLGNYKRAIVDYNMAIKLNKQQAVIYYNRGYAYYQLASYKQAIADFSRTIEINPEFADAYYNLGLVYLQSGNKKQALIDIKKAADLGLKDAMESLKGFR